MVETQDKVLPTSVGVVGMGWKVENFILFPWWFSARKDERKRCYTYGIKDSCYKISGFHCSMYVCWHIDEKNDDTTNIVWKIFEQKFLKAATRMPKYFPQGTWMEWKEVKKKVNDGRDFRHDRSIKFKKGIKQWLLAFIITSDINQWHIHTFNALATKLHAIVLDNVHRTHRKMAWQ